MKGNKDIKAVSNMNNTLQGNRYCKPERGDRKNYNNG